MRLYELKSSSSYMNAQLSTVDALGILQHLFNAWVLVHSHPLTLSLCLALSRQISGDSSQATDKKHMQTCGQEQRPVPLRFPSVPTYPEEMTSVGAGCDVVGSGAATLCRRNLPVIVAEICVQRVQIETHSHGGAHELRDHLSKPKWERNRDRNDWNQVPSSLCLCVSLSLKSLLLCSQFSRSAAELYRQRRAFSRVMQSVSKFPLSPSNPLCCETRQAWRSGGAAVARSGSERCAFLCCGAFSVSISLPWHWREQSGETHVVFREGEHAQWALHWREKGEKVASEVRICGFACY